MAVSHRIDQVTPRYRSNVQVRGKIPRPQARRAHRPTLTRPFDGEALIRVVIRDRATRSTFWCPSPTHSPAITQIDAASLPFLMVHDCPQVTTIANVAWYFRGADHRESRTTCTTLRAIFLSKLTGAFASDSMLKDHALPDFTHRSVRICQHMGLGVEFHHVSILRYIPRPRRKTAAIRVSGPSKCGPGILHGEGQF